MDDNVVIGEGGFGCVFSKPLKCKNKTRKNIQIPTGNVSKLMLKPHALTEYDISMRIYEIVKLIPNHSKYFILHDMSICEPDKIPPNLRSEMKKCKNLLKKYNIDGFNERILMGEILQLNIPYGGNSLIELWDRMIFSSFAHNKKLHQEFCSSIDGIITLLTKAVIPMNKMGVYHNDIKSDNVLYNYNAETDKSEFRIIDWGLSVISTPSKIIDTGKPPFQWNFPLIGPFMLSGLYEDIRTLSTSCKGKNAKDVSGLLESYMVNISGHIDYIESNILPILENSPSSDLKIGDILSNNIDKYIDVYGTSKSRKYEFIENVLSYNIDIIGIISIFINLLMSNYNTGTSGRRHPIFNHLKKILWKYIYSGEYVTIAIPISTLIMDLNNMKYL